MNSSEPSADALASAIDAARLGIDRVDRQLLELLAERLEHVRHIADHKASSAAPLQDPVRESELFDRWTDRAVSAGVPRELATGVLERLVESSRRLQERRVAQHERPTVAYQGEAGSYSDLALRKLFELREQDAQGLGHETFFDAFEALASGTVDYALLPIENSIVGAIGEVSAGLVRRRLNVVDEEVVEVRHVLAARPGVALESVRRVRSHPVALRQCQSLVSERSLRVASCVDTAAAARELARSDSNDLAVICSQEAARAHGLAVLVRDVADVDSNRTRFVLLAREPESPPVGARVKTSLVLTLDHERGSLAACLDLLAAHGINMTRIESHPHPRRTWEYRFLIDVEGDAASEPLAAAVGDLSRACNGLRVLGSYPQRLTQGLARPPADSTVRPTADIRVTEPAPSKPELEVPHATRVIDLAGVPVGGEAFALIAGPCAVESESQIRAAAAAVAQRGVRLMRGGAFKPRTSPHSFQGLGAAGLVMLAEASREHGLGVVTEVLRIEDIDLLVEHADVLQVGARNMQNFELLKELGKLDTPILLKRGMSSTFGELLGAVEYVTAGGNQRVVICERGIRTFETATRFSIDLAATAALMQRTQLPVIVDPSHAAGRRDLVRPLALAAAAAGVHGLIVEVHPDRDAALCDKEQALSPEDLDLLIEDARPIVAAQGRTL